jgi:ribosomal protein S5
MVKATIDAFKQMQTAAEVAEARGMSVRELFGSDTEAENG